MFERAKDFYNKHEPACTAGFFVAGFLFDVLLVGRIDKLHNVIHQATYLTLCAWLTGLDGISGATMGGTCGPIIEELPWWYEAVMRTIMPTPTLAMFFDAGSAFTLK